MSSSGVIIDGVSGVNQAQVNSDHAVKVYTSPSPDSASGLSTYRTLDLDETAQNIKLTAGNIYSTWFTNNAIATRWIKFYNKANAVVGVDTPQMTFGIPGNSSQAIGAILTGGGEGISFATAISFACTTGLADNNAGAPGVNDVVANVFYK